MGSSSTHLAVGSATHPRLLLSCFLPRAANMTISGDGGGWHPPYRRRKRDRPPSPNRHNTPKTRKITSANQIRPWVSAPGDHSAYKDTLVMVSYNILGVENASKHSDLYHHASQQHLSWNLRKKRIHMELKLYDPTIICLQEVDQFQDLCALLDKDGYSGVFKRRTGEASDGCAIFWKKERFTLLHEENIEFRKFGLRDNVAQLCLFEVVHSRANVSKRNDTKVQAKESIPSQTILVGNTHMLFNPKRGDIKLGQIRTLLEKADTLSREWGNSAFVMAGDFNSMPQSAVYQFISSSELDILTFDRRKVSGQIESSSRYGAHLSRLKYCWSEEEICLAAGNGGCTRIQNPLKLQSAYMGVPGSYDTRDHHGEPLATSCHSKFTGTVDYIWHSSTLVPIRLVETLPINILRRSGGLPTKDWGSDHLALVCELAFVDDTGCSTKNRRHNRHIYYDNA